MLSCQRRIVRVPYLTPFKIVLLLLIHNYAHYKLINENNPAIIRFVLDNIKNDDAQNEPPLQAIFELIDSENNIIQQQVRALDSPDALFSFIEGLNSILDDGDRLLEEANDSEQIIMNKTSIFGTFIRKCRIEFFKLTVSQQVELYKIFHAYASGHSGHAGLVSTTAPMDITPAGTDIEGWVSENHISAFLDSQAQTVSRSGSSDIAPHLLHEYLNFLENHAMCPGQAHQVRFLNYLRTNEYEAAVNSLHEFFDSCNLYQETSIQHYALLNLGILEAKFGHVRAATAALKESRNRAREVQDNECLAQVSSWLRFIDRARSDDPDIFRQTLVHHPEIQESSNMIYLECLEKLAQARDMMQRGYSTTHIFDLIATSSIKSSVHNVDYILRAQHLLQAHVWKRYGRNELFSLYVDLALDVERGTVDDLEKAYILAAELHTSEGEYQQAIQVLMRFSERYPSESDVCVSWRQIMNTLTQKLDSRTPALESQTMIPTNTMQPLDEKTGMLRQFAEQLYRKHHINDSIFILKEQGNKLTGLRDKAHMTEILLSLAEISLGHGYYDDAVQCCEAASGYSTETGDMKGCLKTIITLCAVKLARENASEVKQAIALLDQAIPQAYSSGSLELQSELFFVYSKALYQAGDEGCMQYLDKAESGFRRLGIDMKHKQALLLKALILRKRGHVRESVKVLKQMEGA
ncbi:anaphase-promoting complex subunit 5-domain-containing protein [Syncephalastrum racemosum]|uniref:Anaphase-promoting complex subunit 5 n=1 Tax=Syncephalastrum racemosum TaxID=13706 RepID=A0A1X2H7X8_SYNRA|nr:anaphase-promoting complex subunit 5-domain-containing protein [Syncephalastrum racemosum]